MKSPAIILGGTFMLWIAAKGRLPMYMKLATTQNAASKPSSTSKASATPSSNPSLLGGVGSFVDDVLKGAGLSH